ncbi:hypothetical protein LJ754_06300 [Arthrobacter sp. zg-Y40]|uniref:hypothetical protein n=2 Tax=Arthrobacter TaxID=1663 RepID=UPI0024DF5A91|nr:hypothetical protein [Arthrobacter sp. zg-Y20]MCC3278770.1 hypothetical protein [Arthrobacter sp. zg-Y40]MCC9177144.1 hypothetical protein [Arthrobacter sp. zg-Y750]MDK1315962.1 hypothetical protein [Arthrobacter sp. zg.Y20]MCC3275805.1 hypothetical protein [Arthrobacter sp. zg-Y20]WIB06261.1 hypothetical protein QNO06_00455 [Arthrobacter sp. zg-Y20]
MLMEGARSIGALDNHPKKEGAGMSEYPNEEEQLKDPKPSGVSTNDDNYRGDVGDQGNDIRFAEEEALIREQSSGSSLPKEEGEYTDADGARTDRNREGGYTDSEGTQDGK